MPYSAPVTAATVSTGPNTGTSSDQPQSLSATHLHHPNHLTHMQPSSALHPSLHHQPSHMVQHQHNMPPQPQSTLHHLPPSHLGPSPDGKNNSNAGWYTGGGTFDPARSKRKRDPHDPTSVSSPGDSVATATGSGNGLPTSHHATSPWPPSDPSDPSYPPAGIDHHHHHHPPVSYGEANSFKTSTSTAYAPDAYSYSSLDHPGESNAWQTHSTYSGAGVVLPPPPSGPFVVESSHAPPQPPPSYLHEAMYTLDNPAASLAASGLPPMSSFRSAPYHGQGPAAPSNSGGEPSVVSSPDPPTDPSTSVVMPGGNVEQQTTLYTWQSVTHLFLFFFLASFAFFFTPGTPVSSPSSWNHRVAPGTVSGPSFAPVSVADSSHHQSLHSMVRWPTVSKLTACSTFHPFIILTMHFTTSLPLHVPVQLK